MLDQSANTKNWQKKHTPQLLDTEDLIFTGTEENKQFRILNSNSTKEIKEQASKWSHSCLGMNSSGSASASVNRVF